MLDFPDIGKLKIASKFARLLSDEFFFNFDVLTTSEHALL